MRFKSEEMWLELSLVAAPLLHLASLRLSEMLRVHLHNRASVLETPSETSFVKVVSNYHTLSVTSNPVMVLTVYQEIEMEMVLESMLVLDMVVAILTEEHWVVQHLSKE